MWATEGKCSDGGTGVAIFVLGPNLLLFCNPATRGAVHVAEVNKMSVATCNSYGYWLYIYTITIAITSGQQTSPSQTPPIYMFESILYSLAITRHFSGWWREPWNIISISNWNIWKSAWEWISTIKQDVQWTLLLLLLLLLLNTPVQVPSRHTHSNIN